jgi:predicted amidohydrolase
MKISVAQARPSRGDISKNIENHKRLIDLAISVHADMIFFPELSITGYEPELASDLAIAAGDRSLHDFQKISDANTITIGVGMPSRSERGLHISMFIFQPHQPQQIYSKQYLHSDEFPWFVNGDQPVFLSHGNEKIAPAICYELSVPEHSENAHSNKATVYIASVAEHVKGIEKSNKKLPGIAEKYGMIVLRANMVGPSDNFIGAGQSAIWNNKGQMLAQLNETDEGLLIIDTNTMDVINL